MINTNKVRFLQSVRCTYTPVYGSRTGKKGLYRTESSLHADGLTDAEGHI